MKVILPKWTTSELICIHIIKAQNIVQGYHSFSNPWNEKFWGEMKRILSFLRNLKKMRRSEEILRDFREKSQQDFRGFFLFLSTFPWVQMKRVCFSLITRRIGVFSGPYFPVFGQNTKNYRVNFKIFPWVFPDFSNFPLIFQVFPECCKSWVFPQTYCIKIPTFQGFFLDHNERL